MYLRIRMKTKFHELHFRGRSTLNKIGEFHLSDHRQQPWFGQNSVWICWAGICVENPVEKLPGYWCDLQIRTNKHLFVTLYTAVFVNQTLICPVWNPPQTTERKLHEFTITVCTMNIIFSVSPFILRTNWEELGMIFKEINFVQFLHLLK